jgi:peptidoglycan biosynthesis protein MviN/MurJ (putative lipid II flippase)
VVLALALVHSLGVKGLALSLSVAYTAAAVAGLLTLRRWLGPLGTVGAWQPLRPVAISTVVMAAVVVVVANLSGSTSLVALVLRVGGAVACGLLAFAGTAALLGRRAARQRGRRVFVAGSRDGRPLGRP